MTKPPGSARLAVQSDADIVVTRRTGRELAAAMGFSPSDQVVVATAISEVARNIVEFARRGEILVEATRDAQREGIRIVAHDDGPGIPDVDRALQDGYSTRNGLGLGLPGIRRIMDEFHIESKIGCGTTVTMTKWRRAAGQPPSETEAASGGRA